MAGSITKEYDYSYNISALDNKPCSGCGEAIPIELRFVERTKQWAPKRDNRIDVDDPQQTFCLRCYKLLFNQEDE